jgi:peroxiredoxin
VVYKEKKRKMKKQQLKEEVVVVVEQAFVMVLKWTRSQKKLKQDE